MPRAERRPWSPFYWADWLADPAVQSMSFDEQGRYVRVLAFTNQSVTPGRMTEDDVRRWAGFSEADWPEHRVAFARCFAVNGEVWTQKRTVLEAMRAAERSRMQSVRGRKGAAVTNSLRKDSTLAPPLAPRPEGRPEVVLPQSQSHAQESEQAPVPVLAFDLASESSASPVSENTLLRKARFSPIGEETAFEQAWKTYPHFGARSRKAMALRAWRTLRPPPILSDVLTGIATCADSDDWTKDDGRYVPGMQVWIRQRGWDTSNGRGEDNATINAKREMVRRTLEREDPLYRRDRESGPDKRG